MATPTGIALIKRITNPTLKSAKLTGQWERKLRDIESGSFSTNDFIGQMNEMVKSLVDEVVLNRKPVEVKKIVCPKCKKGQVLKGKQAYGCSEWKNKCSFQIPFEMDNYKWSKSNVMDLISGKEVDINGVKYYFNNEFNLERRNSKEDYGDCPKCKKGQIKKGKTAFGCTNFKECDVRIDLDQEEYIVEVLMEMHNEE